MHYNYGLIAGAIAGAIVGLLLVGVIKKCVIEKGRANMKKYDERQEIFRGRAYKMAFYTLPVYTCAVGLFELADVKIPMEPFLITIVGVILSCMVLAIYLTKHDAYFTLRENPRKVLVACLALSILNFVLGFLIQDEDFIVDGMLSVEATNFICGAAILVIAGYAYLHMKKKRSEEEYDDAEEDEDEES